MSLWSEHPVPRFCPKKNELACSRRPFKCTLSSTQCRRLEDLGPGIQDQVQLTVRSTKVNQQPCSCYAAPAVPRPQSVPQVWLFPGKTIMMSVLLNHLSNKIFHPLRMPQIMTSKYIMLQIRFWLIQIIFPNSLQLVVDLVLCQVPLTRHKAFSIIPAVLRTIERLGYVVQWHFFLVFSSSMCYTVLRCSALVCSCCAVKGDLRVVPYLVGLIPVCIYADAMPTECLRVSLAVIKLRSTVRPIGFWSTGAANGESRQKNQNDVFI